jgi:hypothetical protein
MSKYVLFPAIAGLALAAVASFGHAAAQSKSSSSAPDTRLFEMRTYYAAPGKLDDLNARFRNHTLKIFEKHRMQNIGYWVPVENPDNKLIYILAFPNRAARDQAWKEFSADPDWQKAQKASEVNGRLVTKADSVFMTANDYSPVLQPANHNVPRLFELRTYTAAPGKLADLNQRFRGTTVKLFAKHGITNIGYWTPTEQKQGADNTLIYIVAHPDKASADKAWKEFREDSDWTTAKRASEVNGPLTVTNGVKSVYMTPTDYSPWK